MLSATRYFAERYYAPRYFAGAAMSGVTGSYRAARYFSRRYFAPRYFSNEASLLSSGSYRSARYFSTRYFATRYFAGRTGVYELSNELFSTLFASSVVHIADLGPGRYHPDLFVDRELETALSASTTVVGILRVRRILYPPDSSASNLEPTTATTGQLRVNRGLTSTLSAAMITAAADLISNFIPLAATLSATTDVLEADWAIRRGLSGTLAARTSTESWLQSVTVSWTDPTPEYTSFYELEWRRNSYPSFVITSITDTTHTFQADVIYGDIIYTRIRSASADAIPIYSEWSEWSDGYAVPNTPDRPELTVLNPGENSVLSATTTVPSSKLAVRRPHTSALSASTTTSTPYIARGLVPTTSALSIATVVADADWSTGIAHESALTATTVADNADWFIGIAHESALSAVSSVADAILFVTTAYDQTSALSATTVVADADIVVERGLQTAAAAASATEAAALVIERELISTLAPGSTIPAGDLVVSRELVSSLTPASAVEDAALITRGAFSSALSASVTTAGALVVERPLTTALVETTAVTDADWIAGYARELSSLLVSTSNVPVAHRIVYRAFDSTLYPDTTVADGRFRIERAMTSALSAGTTLADSYLFVTSSLPRTSILSPIATTAAARLRVARLAETELAAEAAVSGAIWVGRSLTSSLTNSSATAEVYLSAEPIVGLITMDEDTLLGLAQPYITTESIQPEIRVTQ
jgi:hypothetical protein